MFAGKTRSDWIFTREEVGSSFYEPLLYCRERGFSSTVCERISRYDEAIAENDRLQMFRERPFGDLRKARRYGRAFLFEDSAQKEPMQNLLPAPTQEG